MSGDRLEVVMGDAARTRATRNYRARLRQRGLARFEVFGLEADRDLIRALSRRLAAEGPDAERLRVAVQRVVAGRPAGGIDVLAALRRSPLVGVELDLSRPHDPGRDIEL